MTGDRIAKIMRATRWVALGTTLTLCALATGSIGFQVYKNLDALRSIDANQNDRHLQRLSMEHERLFYLASQNVPTDQIDGVVADILTSIDLIKQQNVIDNKFLQSRTERLLNDIQLTLVDHASNNTRSFNANTHTSHVSQLQELSIETATYLADQRMSQQTAVANAMNNLILTTACALIAIIAGAAMLLRSYMQQVRHAEDGRQAARQSETILSTTLDAVVVTNAEGIITKYNHSAEQMFGYSSVEAIGQDISDLIIPEQYRRAHKAGMNRYLKSNSKRVIGSGRVKLHARDKSKRQFPVELSLEVIEQEGDTFFISFLRDISDEVAAEQELIKARDQALKSEHAKADFLAIMSHEMRTPLNGLIGAIELLQETELTPTQEKYLKTVRQSASELRHHVNDVLDIAHMETGKISPVDEAFDLRLLIDQIIDANSDLAELNENNLSVDWSASLASVVSSDPHKLGQIVSNLINNAVKFTQRGQITIQVDRHINPHEEFMVELRVTDTGIGIPDRYLQHIFDDFTTLDNSYTRSSSGVGLGLGIVRRMVAALNGTMGVNSHEGAGSTFWVRIPMRKVPETEFNTNAKMLDVSPFQPLRILMVEDNDINRFVLNEMLSNEGHHVVEAANGKIAIDTLAQNEFDVILMDISMPIMDGVAATQHIREHAHTPNIPIIACTAHTQPKEIERFRKAGMTDFVQKPIEKSKLLPVLYRSVLALETEHSRSVEMTNDILDIKILSDLSEQLGQDTAEILLTRYEDEANALMNLLHSEEGQTVAVEDLVKDIHKTAGSSAQLGLPAMRHKLNVIELNAKKNGADAIWSELDTLTALWNESKSALKAKGYLG